ncbi:MAG UNVERIFIED_CONTAM: excisionase family DNA-binding protein [Anaerolineae bacterium]
MTTHTLNQPKLKIEPGAVYSRQEAAEALGISLSTLKRLIKKGHLQASKPNGNASGIHHRRKYHRHVKPNEPRTNCVTFR